MLKMQRIKVRFIIIFSLTLALLLSAPAFAQNKFPKAIERSEDAARIIELLVVGPDSGLPKELTDKAVAIGVFPKVEKQSALFSQASQGYGVISARLENGWTLPAFYQFGGSGFGNPFAKNEMYGLVLLF